MLGPREIGAGTQRQGPNSNSRSIHNSNHHHQSRETGPDFIFHPYGDIASGSMLTPAQRLIAQYERLSTTPPLRREKSTFRRQIVHDYSVQSQGGYGDGYGYDYERAQMGLPNNLHCDRDWDRDKDIDGKNAKKNAFKGIGNGEYLKKEKSPIRQSLKNLLTVFKKSTSGFGKRRVEDHGMDRDRNKLDPPLAIVSDARYPSPDRDAKTDEANTSRLGIKENPNKAASSSSRSSPSHTKNMTGSLLYLTRPPQLFAPDIPGSLTWSSCSVTLEVDGRTLKVSSFTGDMELSVHEILLSHCADIHSLSFLQLSSEEARLLEQVPDGEHMKVFELIFEGRPREKFAARSVRDRAGWISAIWDAVLPNKSSALQQESSNVNESVSSKNNIFHTTNSPILESPFPTPLQEQSNLLNPFSSERTLPPLPPPSPFVPDIPAQDNNNINLNLKSRKLPNLHLDLSEFAGPISPSIYPPTSHASPLPHPIHDKSRNLRHQLLRLDTSLSKSKFATSSAGVSEDCSEAISPSLYPTLNFNTPSSFVLSPVNSASTAITSPVSPSGSTSTPVRPSSPSIVNLSQLSVVRQRLAQIERNHSQISTTSGNNSPLRTGTPIPVSPVSPAGSQWSKREAVFHNTSERNKNKRDILAVDSKLVPKYGDVSRNYVGDENKHQDSYFTGHPLKMINHGKREGVRDGGFLKNKVQLPPAHLDERLPSKDDVWTLSKEVGQVKDILGGANGCATVHEMVVELNHQSQSDGQTLKMIQKDLSRMEGHLSCAVNSIYSSKNPTTSSKLEEDPPSPSSEKTRKDKDDEKMVMQTIHEVKDRFAADFHTLIEKMRDMERARAEDKTKTKATLTCNNMEISSAEISSDKAIDLQAVLLKLDEIKSFHTLLTKKEEMKVDDIGDNNFSLQIEKILSLVQEDSHKQTLLSQQQADSVRYLNELNSWLEAFVNNGTSQIQAVSANIENLCREIGCYNSFTPDIPATMRESMQPNLLNDIRQLVVGMQARDENFSALQAAIHSLLEILTVAQTQKGADSQAIAGLIDRQRHDQEALFRTFTNEISGEIKGERLRFVEAMKEATAINVQIHVEQFKQELSREVMAMTEEVGRLHREKQVVENQISDLFSFYSKHKRTEVPLQVVQPNTGLAPNDTLDKPQIRRSYGRRPLPSPR